ncbi:ABC transporter ATP-binding protein [Clostridium sp. D43t1_170807_H7]|uniref:ABC transporter ATP-binding protein n=1 Tax=Clostridium sp. D43t1_170807_H7 TaxID=2787140 RepID=UPI001897B731|nr:ABC transporter ATP-binding protein [Clostridium sp. D43t1_170807_H7]
MEKVLMVNNLYKKIGNKKIIKDLNLTLNKGKVLGILGPNGKGKTTLLNIISGIKKATSGDVLIDGIKVSSETKKSVSFLQEKNTLSNWMTIKDAVEFYKDFFQDFNEEKVKELLAFMNLDEKLKIKSLSKGMLEKLHLSLTLSRKAKLYILDEPISGIDIVTREKIIKAIIDNIEEDSSMIITTHYVGELEGIFDEVAFLDEGKIIEINDAEVLREKYGKSIEEIYKYIFAE